MLDEPADLRTLGAGREVDLVVPGADRFQALSAIQDVSIAMTM